MIRRRRTFWPGLTGLIVVLTASHPFLAANVETVNADWGTLKRLTHGQQIEVVLNDVKSYRGRLEAVTDETLSVLTTAGNMTFPRENILRVSCKKPTHRLRNAGLGALGGTGVGIGIGVNAAHDSEVAGLAYLISIPVSAGIGAGIGAVLPTGGWREVYRAR